MRALLTSKFLVKSSNAECGGLETAYKDSRQTFRQNVRANLTNFIQHLFWRVRFSNEDFKMVEDGLASLAIVKIWTWVFLDHHAAQSLDVRRKAERFISASNLNELHQLSVLCEQLNKWNWQWKLSTLDSSHMLTWSGWMNSLGIPSAVDQ